jgi:2-haloacid dehalogenase
VTSRPTVVFDLGNVLIEWDPHPAIAAAVGSDRARAFLAGDFGFAAWNHAQDAGRSWEDAEAAALATHPHLAEEIRAYRTHFELSMLGPVEGSVTILETLAAHGVRLLALTNWSAELFPRALQRFDFLSLFEHITVSGRISLAKPDPSVFHRLAADAPVDLLGTVFVDDSPANVAAAASVGMDAITFTTPAELAHELALRGLPVPTPAELGEQRT